MDKNYSLKCAYRDKLLFHLNEDSDSDLGVNEEPFKLSN